MQLESILRKLWGSDRDTPREGLLIIEPDCRGVGRNLIWGYMF